MMSENEVPCGDIHYFEGDALVHKPDLLSFCYCEVTVPNNLEHPILQVHYNNRTVSPTGTYEGVFYSKEIHHARSLGYIFNIKRKVTVTIY